MTLGRRRRGHRGPAPPILKHYTEQVAFLDGHDKVEWREGGTRELFGKLDVYLRRT